MLPSGGSHTTVSSYSPLGQKDAWEKTERQPRQKKNHTHPKTRSSNGLVSFGKLMRTSSCQAVWELMRQMSCWVLLHCAPSAQSLSPIPHACRRLFCCGWQEDRNLRNIEPFAPCCDFYGVRITPPQRCVWCAMNAPCACVKVHLLTPPHLPPPPYSPPLPLDGSTCRHDSLVVQPRDMRLQTVAYTGR